MLLAKIQLSTQRFKRWNKSEWNETTTITRPANNKEWFVHSPSNTSDESRCKCEDAGSEKRKNKKKKVTIKSVSKGKLLEKTRLTDRSPLSECPAAPAGWLSQCEGAPHSAPPADNSEHTLWIIPTYTKNIKQTVISTTIRKEEKQL